jgi:hypothetical protein
LPGQKLVLCGTLADGSVHAALNFFCDESPGADATLTRHPQVGPAVLVAGEDAIQEYFAGVGTEAGSLQIASWGAVQKCRWLFRWVVLNRPGTEQVVPSRRGAIGAELLRRSATASLMRQRRTPIWFNRLP